MHLSVTSDDFVGWYFSLSTAKRACFTASQPSFVPAST